WVPSMLIASNNMPRWTLHTAQHTRDQFAPFGREIQSLAHAGSILNRDSFPIRQNFYPTRETSPQSEVAIEPHLCSSIAHSNAHAIAQVIFGVPSDEHPVPAPFSTTKISLVGHGWIVHFLDWAEKFSATFPYPNWRLQRAPVDVHSSRPDRHHSLGVRSKHRRHGTFDRRSPSTHAPFRINQMERRWEATRSEVTALEIKDSDRRADLSE